MSDFARKPCPKCGEILNITIDCDHEFELAQARAEIDELNTNYLDIFMRKESRIIGIEAQLAQARELIKNIHTAIHDKGVMPKFHDILMARHKKEWPTLWAALDAILQSVPANPSAAKGEGAN